MRLRPDMVVLSSALRDAGTIVEAFGSSGLKGLTLGALGKVASFSRHFLRENFKLMDIQTRASFYRWARAGAVGLWPSFALTSSRPRRTACRLNERPSAQLLAIERGEHELLRVRSLSFLQLLPSKGASRFRGRYFCRKGLD